MMKLPSLTAKQISKGNRIMASFTGMQTGSGWNPNHISVIHNGQYGSPEFHKSWDWIMPVWIKFYQLLQEKELLTRNFPYYGEWYSKVTGALLHGDIQAMFILLSEGISWYQDNEEGEVVE